MSTQKPSKKSGNCRCSGGPPAEWFWEVILCLPDTAVRAESAKKTPPFGWCFWSGRRGSNSLPGIPRMAVAIRRNPASPLDLTRFAQVEAASSPVLRHISKKNTPSYRMGYSFCDCPQVLLSALPPTARKGECEGGTFDGFPHSRSITRPQATTFAQQKCCSKKKHHPDGWCFFL